MRYQSNALNFKDINNLLEKLTSFLYYQTSCYQSKLKDYGDLTFEVNAVFPKVNLFECSCFRLIDIHQKCIRSGEDGINSLSNIKSTIENFKIKNCWYIAIFNAPFELNINIVKRKLYCFSPLSFGGEREEEEEEEEEEEKQIINADQTFKSDECVICLINTPNVSFCGCGHLSLCIECDKVKSLNTCPVCKTENTIKRTI